MHLSGKIFLIGMPGAGKSTLGRLLAEELLCPFIDLDKEIEKAESSTIREIFEKSREAHFRKVESSLLRSLSEKSTSFVMSTGGGTPCFDYSMDYMLGQGKVIYIEVSLDELNRRLKNKHISRPKLTGSMTLEEHLYELYKNRTDIYNRAHLTITGDSITVEDVMNQK